jgi:hypothetical protein
MVSETESLNMYYILQRMFNEHANEGLSGEKLFYLAWAASRARGGVNFDHDFYAQVVETFESRPEYSGLYGRAAAETPGLSLDDFKRQLATRVGHFQVLYGVAVQMGFKGSLDDLSCFSENLRWAVRVLVNRGVVSSTPLEKMLNLFFSGSADRTLAPVYAERVQELTKVLRQR